MGAVHPETPAEIIEAVGRRIAEVRQQAGWTQEEAAERIGVSARHMKRIEKGLNLTLHSLVRIASALGVATADLLAAPGSWEPRRQGRPRKRNETG